MRETTVPPARPWRPGPSRQRHHPPGLPPPPSWSARFQGAFLPTGCFGRVETGGECGRHRREGAGMHRVRGASGDVLARGPAFPQISAPARPPRPLFPPSRNTPVGPQTVGSPVGGVEMSGGRGALGARHWRRAGPRSPTRRRPGFAGTLPPTLKRRGVERPGRPGPRESGQPVEAGGITAKSAGSSLSLRPRGPEKPEVESHQSLIGDGGQGPLAEGGLLHGGGV